MPTPDENQSEKFKDAAREHGADEDEKRWEERLRRIAKSKPGRAAQTPPDPD